MRRRRRRHPAATGRGGRGAQRVRDRDADAVDSATALKILAERGLFRVLTEGGPLLLSLLIERRSARRALPDGGAASWSAAWRGASPPGAGEVHTRMRPAHLLSDDQGYLYTRYVRAR